jgi:hypothetical protein
MPAILPEAGVGGAGIGDRPERGDGRAPPVHHPADRCVE